MVAFHGLLVFRCTSFRARCCWVAGGTRQQTCRKPQHQELESWQGTGMPQRQLQGGTARKKELIGYKVYKREMFGSQRPGTSWLIQIWRNCINLYQGMGLLLEFSSCRILVRYHSALIKVGFLYPLSLSQPFAQKPLWEGEMGREAKSTSPVYMFMLPRS